ncbi:MAG: hypothetical protein ACODAU_13485 [Myxococcota bacterium]
MAKGWALLAAVVVFVLFLVLKSRWPVRRFGEDGERYGRLAEAKKRARAATDPAARAEALREAAHVALEDLGRPNLAAGLARRAERSDPRSAESVGLLAIALRRATRYRALERQLWRKLAEEAEDSPAYERAFDELIRLYEGPMRRPAQGAVLRRLRGKSGAQRTIGLEKSTGSVKA